MKSSSADKGQLSLPPRNLLRTEIAKRFAKEGNPFPLIGILWPNLIVTSRDDAPWFEGQFSDDPEDDSWLNPCLRLDCWQRDGIGKVFTPGYRQVMTKGCTKAGKGAWTAIAICLWWYLHDPCKIVIVGPNFEHVKNKSMLPEIKRFMRQMADQRQTIINAESINWPDSEDKFIALGNADSDEGFSGIHGPHTLAVFDESSSIRDSLFQQAKTQARMIIALSNPRVNSGWFRECFGLPVVDPDQTQDVAIASGKRRIITVSGYDCANVKAGREVIPAQVTKEILAEVLDPKGKAAWWPRCMGLGRFPEEDTETMLMLPRWIERAEDRWREMLDMDGKSNIVPRGAGLDVGASRDGDPSCLAVAGIEGILRIFDPETSDDTMSLVPWLINLMKSQYGIDISLGAFPVEIDVNGVGKGVYDRLKERGVKVLASNTRTKSIKKTGMYGNARAERYGELSRRLDPDGPWSDQPFALPYDSQLREELIAHEKIYNSSGAFIVTPKKKKPGEKKKWEAQTIYDKIGRSPNRSDAVVYAYDAVADMIRKRAPRVNRQIVMGVSGDGDPVKPPLPKPEDLPEPKPLGRELESIESMAARIARQMDDSDDFGWR